MKKLMIQDLTPDGCQFASAFDGCEEMRFTIASRRSGDGLLENTKYDRRAGDIRPMYASYLACSVCSISGSRVKPAASKQSTHQRVSAHVR